MPHRKEVEVIGPDWRTPASDYPNITYKDKVKIGTVLYSGLRSTYGLRDAEQYETHRLPVRTLHMRTGPRGGWEEWMVDDPPHWWAMQDYAKQCRGSVLVVGLGLGLAVHALRENPAVTGITVIERDKFLVDLMRDELHVLDTEDVPLCDYMDWLEERLSVKDVPRYDSVIWDLFVGDNDTRMLISAYAVYFNLKAALGDVPVFVHGFNNATLEKTWRTAEMTGTAFLPFGGER